MTNNRRVGVLFVALVSLSLMSLVSAQADEVIDAAQLV